ncbi:MAG: hypothetical protein A2119_01575 [Candidatus Colwellbacteria bacterium GWA2_46_10]|uniref:Uncharacterized protein n=1 Tax=Candidatus Colwellbacteria bacterium GWA2_46_10 TaxID=1797684 RepID=A0A1G1YW12_9BACT|nr:MAG: hypothetical protein A2119_01575 [Candidatus Colwellbacteria bacterium GWA2_46_10]
MTDESTIPNQGVGPIESKYSSENAQQAPGWETANEHEVATSGPEFGETQARNILGLDSHIPILIGYLGRESS